MKPHFKLVDNGSHAFVARPRCQVLLQRFIGMRQHISSGREAHAENRSNNDAANNALIGKATHANLRVGEGRSACTIMNYDLLPLSRRWRPIYATTTCWRSVSKYT